MPPHRQITEKRLVVASHNPGKVREISDLLRPFHMEAVSAGELGLAEPEEDGTTFAENAEIKARAAAESSGDLALADDSGLCIDALDGAPGIFSARWAGTSKDFAVAMTRVNEELNARDAVEDAPVSRGAHFVCALCLAWPDGHREIFEGRVFGTIVWPPRGDKGFGYDPVFVPDGHKVTFGEIDPDKKHDMSHRAQAFHRMIEACFRS